MSLGTAYTFGEDGEFQLTSNPNRLTRAAQSVSVPERHLAVLLVLLERAGTVLSKDAIIERAWQGIAVTDNSLEQAVSSLRRTLRRGGGSGVFIETVPRQGYRFVGPVVKAASRASDATLESILSPHRAWLEGRAALETLGRDDVGRAERAFRAVLVDLPDAPSGHLGLANALAFRFESSRADLEPDVTALADAALHAKEACRLDVASGEAWATLGFVLHRCGRAEEARAALRRALALEGDNWRHHLRLAFVSWGEERLRASTRTLQLVPGLALAHWLAASVHVARQAFEAAERELEAGARAQDDQPHEGGRFSAIGLHWLRGLVRLRLGDDHGAQRAFDQELAQEGQQHVYARECCANAWYALGSLHLQRRDHHLAAVALRESERVLPGHPYALALLARLEPEAARVSDLDQRVARLRARGALVDAALVSAVSQASSNARGGVPPPHSPPGESPALVLSALSGAPAGPAGWMIPVEPGLRVWEHGEQWAQVLALLRSRAA